LDKSIKTVNVGINFLAKEWTCILPKIWNVDDSCFPYSKSLMLLFIFGSFNECYLFFQLISWTLW
jgi:hypothetical protein